MDLFNNAPAFYLSFLGLMLLALVLFLAFCYALGRWLGSRRYVFMRTDSGVDLTLTCYFMGLVPIHKQHYKQLQALTLKPTSQANTHNADADDNSRNSARSIKVYANLLSGEKIALKKLVDLKSRVDTEAEIIWINNFIKASSTAANSTEASHIGPIVRHNNRYGSFFVTLLIVFIVVFYILPVLVTVLLFAIAMLFPQEASVNKSSAPETVPYSAPAIDSIKDSTEINPSDNSSDNGHNRNDGAISNGTNSPLPWGQDAPLEPSGADDAVADNDGGNDAEPLLTVDKTVADLPDYIPKIDYMTYQDIYLRQPENNWQIWLTSNSYKDKDLVQTYKTAFNQTGWETSKITELGVYDVEDKLTGNVSYYFEIRTKDKAHYGDVTVFEKDQGFSAILTVPVIDSLPQ